MDVIYKKAMVILKISEKFESSNTISNSEKEFKNKIKNKIWKREKKPSHACGLAAHFPSLPSRSPAAQQSGPTTPFGPARNPGVFL
jgi:hypothetical protein